MNTPAPNSERAGVVAPAPVFFVIASAVGAAIEWLRPSTLLAQPYALIVGAMLIAISIALVAAVLIQMARAKTSFDANKPTSALITSGVFRVCRNPTYLSLALLQAGLAFAFQSLWLLLLVVPAVALTHWGVVLREERYLKHKFGAGYQQYAHQVRRWL
jgi:protein-S-isoprenylcysteine O-methyltransferase Ste14